MAADIIYIGDSVRFDFKAEELGPNGKRAVTLPPGTKIRSGLKKRTSDADPPLVVKKNEAAGGTEQEAHVSDAAAGLFSVYLQPADTAGLAADEAYVCDGIVELADGTRWTAGIATVTTRNRVLRTVP
jgi:hypothetical protein